jgi:hypothetical protein
MATRTIETRLSEIDWPSLDGDTVEIVGRTDGYHERIVVSNPCHVVAVPNSKGVMPIIDGKDATTDKQFAISYPPIEENGLVMVWRTVASGDVIPTGITLENVEIRGANPNNSYTGADGVTKKWGGYASGVYGIRYDGLTLRNCTIHDNSNGVLSGDSQPTKNYRQEGCRIFGNGLVGSDQCHGTYVQAVGAVYIGNWYGKHRAGAFGGSLKDRSSNTLIDGNTIVANGRCVDLSAFYGDSAAARLTADQGATVRHNLLLDDGSALDAIYREGGRALGTVTAVLYNTIIYRVDQSTAYYVRPWRAENDPTATLQIVGNLVDVQPATASGRAPDVRIVDGDAKHDFSPNWIRPATALDHFGDPPVYTGLEHLVISQAAPGYRDEANGDYSLVDGAIAAGFGVGSDVAPVPVVPVPAVPPTPAPNPPPVTSWVEEARVVKLEGPTARVCEVLERKK